MMNMKGFFSSFFFGKLVECHPLDLEGNKYHKSKIWQQDIEMNIILSIPIIEVKLSICIFLIYIASLFEMLGKIELFSVFNQCF